MKGHEDVIAALQQVLTMELTGINQYFLHSKLAKNWGYARLARVQWDESMDEMRHADKVIERMLFLDAAPNMGKYEKIVIGKDAKAMLESDLALEMKALDVLRRGIEASATGITTTARASSSSTCWWTRRSTSTGSRPSWPRSRSWAWSSGWRTSSSPRGTRLPEHRRPAGPVARPHPRTTPVPRSK